MKGLLLYFTLLMSSGACLAQSFSSLVVRVVEKGTGKPIANAHVSIKETGYTEKSTGNDGKVLFSNSVPVGEITYLITKEGFQGVKSEFNITTEVKSNTLNVELSKDLLPNEDKILIRGEVLDKYKRDVEGALVEIKVADIIKTTKTDQSGNYMIEVVLGKTQYQDPMVRIEIKDRDCKKVESVPIPRTNFINSDFVLECSEAPSTVVPGTDSISSKNHNVGNAKNVGDVNAKNVNFGTAEHVGDNIYKERLLSDIEQKKILQELNKFRIAHRLSNQVDIMSAINSMPSVVSSIKKLLGEHGYVVVFHGTHASPIDGYYFQVNGSLIRLTIGEIN